MPVSENVWPAVDQFHNRLTELQRLEDWWQGTEREPLTLYGRRRVGKSWLFRRFAHGKPAVILVADKIAMRQLLDRFAQTLATSLDVTPSLNSPAELFRVLYRLARTQRTLVVIDEFPYLLGSTSAEQDATLTSIQAVMEEERDSSQIKLILTGSTIATMQELQAERSPLHGRMVPYELKPLRFSHAVRLLEPVTPARPDGLDSVALTERLVQFSVAGGMPRYLTAIRGGSIKAAITRAIVSPTGPLFNEPRLLLSTELREPAKYFSILSALSDKARNVTDIAAALQTETRELAGYLNTLESLDMVSRHQPVGAKPTARGTLWRCNDDFMRFWFRFVLPFQAELEAGADPSGLVDLEVMPNLPQHTSHTFERVAQDWLRLRYSGRASEVGSWWGPSLHHLRTRKVRQTEEVDGVAAHRGRVLAVCEVKWTRKKMDASVLSDLLAYKLPAMAQAGLAVDETDIVLSSLGGFTQSLTDLASTSPRVQLLSAGALLGDLTA